MQIAACHMVYSIGHILGQKTCAIQYHILLSMYVPHAPSVSIFADRAALNAASYNHSLRDVTGMSPSLSPNSFVYLGSCRVRVGLGG